MTQVAQNTVKTTKIANKADDDAGGQLSYDGIAKEIVRARPSSSSARRWRWL